MWQHHLIIAVVIAGVVPASDQQLTVDSRYRVDCFPEPNPTSASCSKRGCVWDEKPSISTAPKCYFPRGTGMNVMSVSGDEVALIKEEFPPPLHNPANPYGADISPLSFTKRYFGATLNIRIQPRSSVLKRFEPDVGLYHHNTYASDSLDVEMDVEGIFAFYVKRHSTHTTLWNNSIGGGLMFSDKYIQLSSYLPSENLYGFGENAHHTIRHDLKGYTTWGMMARDEGPDSFGTSTKNLYGVYAFYVCVENGGNAHGVLIVNSNAQEVTTGPGPHFIYRTIGGMIDMYVFPGPTPEDVIKQYQVLVGRPTMPAYWALGYQLSRYGYKDLNDQKAAIKRTQDAGIPLDAPNFDIDYMDRYMDFTIGKNWSDIGKYVDDLHNQGLHSILIFDPAIDVTSDAFKRARQKDAAFVEWPRDDLVPTDIQNLYETTIGTKTMLGVVWPDHHTAFPDFSDLQSNTLQWWVDEYKLYHKQISFDGIWIDMNEPANFGTNEDVPWYFGLPDHPNITSLKCNKFDAIDRQYDYPPFKTHNVYYYGPGAELASKTMCMLGTTRRGAERLYDDRNLYGLYEAKATIQALYDTTGKRGIVVSRSTFPTAGRYTGHWLGDNQAAWPTLMTTIVGVQEFNMFGVPYVGSDICGYGGDTSEELCLRWHQIGAFHSFSRNHNNNGAKPQDPAQWQSVALAAKQALLFRYHYLPYLYSLHFIAARTGGTVVRPVFFEFPKDEQTLNLGNQFMWGSGMMIVPVTTMGAENVSAYLPATATWYSLRDDTYGSQVKSGTMYAKRSELIPVFARGGVIIPRQAPSTTTTASRKNPLELLVANDLESNTAEGVMFWDDGESIIDDFGAYIYDEFKFTFTYTSQGSTLTILRVLEGITPMPMLENIDFFGIVKAPDFMSVQFNGQPVDMSRSYYNPDQKLFSIQTSIKLDQLHTITSLTWKDLQETTSTKLTTPSTTTATTTTAPTTTSSTPELHSSLTLLSLIGAAYLFH